jgi:hypothetical protein
MSSSVSGARFGVGQGLFQPGEEFAQGGAVLFHRGAHVDRVLLALARLGQRGRVDGFDDFDLGRNPLASAVGDAARVEQHDGVGRQAASAAAAEAYGATSMPSSASVARSSGEILPSATYKVARVAVIRACDRKIGLKLTSAPRRLNR